MHLAHVGLPESFRCYRNLLVDIAWYTSMTFVRVDLVKCSFEAAERVRCTLHFSREGFSFSVEVQKEIRAGEG